MAKTQREIVTDEAVMNRTVEAMYGSYATLNQTIEVLEKYVEIGVEAGAHNAELVVGVGDSIEKTAISADKALEAISSIRDEVIRQRKYIAELEENTLRLNTAWGELIMIKNNPRKVRELLDTVGTVIVNLDRFFSASAAIVCRVLYVAHPLTREEAVDMLPATVIADWQGVFARAVTKIIDSSAEETDATKDDPAS